MLLDGFPRTLVQAKKLDEIMTKNGKNINKVLDFQIDDSLLVERITGRRFHMASGRSYHVKFRPPKVEGKDDVTGKKSLKIIFLGEDLVQRKDDNEKTLIKRLQGFHSSTKPILSYYREHNILEEVQANDRVENIWNHIQSRLG